MLLRQMEFQTVAKRPRTDPLGASPWTKKTECFSTASSSRPRISNLARLTSFAARGNVAFCNWEEPAICEGARFHRPIS